jgi:hypothetical protein
VVEIVVHKVAKEEVTVETVVEIVVHKVAKEEVMAEIVVHHLHTVAKEKKEVKNNKLPFYNNERRLKSLFLF